ncbi:MAG: binding domain protein [Chloroflexi bacterium]|nr:binding domain protein [Chloroflexota bacterium]
MDEAETSAQRPTPGGEPLSDQEMMDFLVGTPASVRSLRRGEVVEGIVVQVGRDEILIDIGTKAEAVVPASEFGQSSGSGGSEVAIGDTVVAVVLEPENREGHATLSLALAQTERGWRNLQKVFDEAQTIEAEVVDFNKGGLIVHIDGVRGFVPVSQVVDMRQPGGVDESVDARLERMKGRTLALKVIEMNRRRNRLILSQRAAEQERRARDRDQLFDELDAGQTRTGRVTSVCDFGAFVDVGGADGLVHITELSWSPVSHPSQVVQLGDQVEVLILNVDREKKKIALSMKRLRAEPWDEAIQNYSPGQVVTARVTKLATFGAFAEIEPGVEGLIHISELSDERIQHPKSVVHEGDVVTLKILRIEPERRRLGLSLKQAQADAAAAEAEEMPMVYGDSPSSMGGLGGLSGWRDVAEDQLAEGDASRRENDASDPETHWEVEVTASEQVVEPSESAADEHHAVEIKPSVE